MKFSTEEQRRALAATVFSRCYLVGEFTLRSGRSASRYFDKYQFESDPELLKALAGEMAALVPLRLSCWRVWKWAGFRW